MHNPDPCFFFHFKAKRGFLFLYNKLEGSFLLEITVAPEKLQVKYSELVKSQIKGLSC
jgi:hypothetical protein